MSANENRFVKALRCSLVAGLLVLAACQPKSTTTVQSTTTLEPTTTTELATTTDTSTTDAAAVGGTLDHELLTNDGRSRTYHLYVPATLPAEPVPLLIALHGGTGSGTQFQRQSGFDELADSSGLLVVYPDGIGLGDNNALRTWNGGYCCGTAAKRNVDDVGFIDAMIDAIATEYDIDASRIFAAGHSNGGIMAYRLACELSDRIVAIGLQAGSLGVDQCEPSQPVSVLHLHGTADENHPIEGGEGPKSIANVSFRSAQYSVETLAAAMACAGQPVESVDPANPDRAITAWTQCRDGVEIRLVAVAGAPHKWMPDASAGILEFLLNHPRG